MEDLNKNYYENLKNESYKAMLDSEIQASVARDQAMKYTQNQMNATGYGNQGLAQSSMVGIQNNYRNALANAANQYESNINEINLKESESQITQDDDSFKSVSALMGGATTQETLDNIYKAYKDDTSLSDNSRKQLDMLYGIYSDAFKTTDTITNAQFTFDDANVIVTDEDGETDEVSLSGKFKAEMKTLKQAVATNSLPNDSYVKVKDEKGYYFFVRYYNGAMYYVSGDEYNKSNNKYSIYAYDKIKKV